MKPRIPLSLLLAVLLPAVAVAQNAERSERATISSSGEAVIYVTPDEVTLSLGIEAFHARLDDAKSELDRSSKTLLAALKETGVDPSDIQTAAVEVEIRYQGGDETDRIKGYVARRSYAIKVKAVDRLEAIVDASLANGANRIFGIDYQTSQLRKHRDEARKMAIRAAKEKGVLLAGELDMTVGLPVQITEGSFWSGYTSSGWGGRGYGGYMTQNAVSIEPGQPGEGTMPLGQIAIRAQISVVFEMRPRE